MLPHEGMGGCTPMPRKLRPASRRMADAKLDADTTMMGFKIFGRICLKIILISLRGYPKMALSVRIL